MIEGDPRQRLTEFLLEASLTTRPIVVVEGNSDQRFIEAWLRSTDSRAITITSVGEIEVPTDRVLSQGFADGNRGRVIVTAQEAQAAGINIRCVADRDCGEGVAQNQIPTLMWTDYPALESYAVSEAVLDTANVAFSGKLPAAAEYMPGLVFALGELWAVRMQNPNLEKPKYRSGLSSPKFDLADFNVSAAISHIDSSSYPRPTSTDPRVHSYGHDVAQLIAAAFANRLKNQAGIANTAAVEGALLAAVLIVGDFKSESLFRSLRTWIDTF